MELDESLVSDLKTYAPAALDEITRLRSEVERLAKMATPAPAPAMEYVPDYLPPATQEIVDGIPELATWQAMKEHRVLWDAAINADSILAESPTYKGQATTPEVLAKRLGDAMQLVKAAHKLIPQAQAPAPAAPTAQQLAKAKIDALPIAQRPVTAGGLRSGESPGLETTDFNQMVKNGATDEEIIAALR